MKKVLTILLVLSIALCAFAAEKTITLNYNKEGTAPTLKVLYGVNEAASADLLVSTNSTHAVQSLANDGVVNFVVKLYGNSASNMNYNVTFVKTNFTLQNATNVTGDATVETTLNITATSDSNTTERWTSSYTSSTNQLSVGYNAYSNIPETLAVEVASGSLTWTGNSDLVAGSYQATITVTVSGE